MTIYKWSFFIQLNKILLNPFESIGIKREHNLGEIILWHLGLLDNDIAYTLARLHFSDDIKVMYLTDNSEHESYYLISPHFCDLPEEEYEKAYYKALSFVRLINAFRRRFIISC